MLRGFLGSLGAERACEAAAIQKEAYVRQAMAEQARMQDRYGAVDLVRQADGSYALPSMIEPDKQA